MQGYINQLKAKSKSISIMQDKKNFKELILLMHYQQVASELFGF
jgi:hypothetical protein